MTPPLTFLTYGVRNSSVCGSPDLCQDNILSLSCKIKYTFIEHLQCGKHHVLLQEIEMLTQYQSGKIIPTSGANGHTFERFSSHTLFPLEGLFPLMHAC